VRRLFLVFIAVFISVGGATNTLAQKTPSRPLNAGEPKKVLLSETQTKPKAEKKRLSGTVVAVDVESKTLVVKNWRGETTFDVAGAKLVRSSNLEDVRLGDRVVMSYTEEDGRKTAKALIATPAKPEEEKRQKHRKKHTIDGGTA
jgi:hypothetical protein